jgi:hypothetical protein
MKLGRVLRTTRNDGSRDAGIDADIAIEPAPAQMARTRFVAPLAFVATAVVASAFAFGGCGGSTLKVSDEGDEADASTGGRGGTSSEEPGDPDEGPRAPWEPEAPTDSPPTARPVLRFVAVGDTGKGNSGQKEVAAAIRTKCQADGCNFVLLLGDNIYESGPNSVDDAQWRTKFEEPYAGIDIPFYAALGNHDYGGNGTGFEFQKAQWSVEYTQRSKKWRMPSEYYSFKAENAEFFALDTNAQMFGRDRDQRREVAGMIARSTSSWKIAFGHHPYRSNGTHGNAGNYDNLGLVPVAGGRTVKSFMEEVVCGKVDLYLSGHDHSRQWLTETCSGTELAVSGAGATGTELRGNNPARFQSTNIGFLYIVIDGPTLRAEFVDTAGQVDFVRTLTKP